jgi:small subunit ribosomal protein S1
VFVDLGGADGLIHISELSWEQVDSPGTVVSIGEELDVYVLRVDREARKIALSLRRLQPEPWQTIGDRYAVGQTVTGTVTKLTNFGAFARIEGSIEGLIHISELSDRVINHPKEVVKEGDVLSLRIIKMEPERRRLGLSAKQTEESWDIELDQTE